MNSILDEVMKEIKPSQEEGKEIAGKIKRVMDKIQKALQKLSPKEALVIKEVLNKLRANDLSGLDLKKLKNNQNIFRIRKGQLRLIFSTDPDGPIKILAIERHSDNTYNQY